MPVEQNPAPAAPTSSADAAKKAGSILDGDVTPIEPSVVTPVEAPAGVAHIGEHMVRQVKASLKMFNGPDAASMLHEFTHRDNFAPSNFYAEGEDYKDSHPGVWLSKGGNAPSGTSLYVANKLVGKSVINRDTPLNHLDLYSAYKSTPHAPASVFLKYLVHRINHVDEYEDPKQGHTLDKSFRHLVTQGGAAEKNGHVAIQDLHDWVRLHAPTVVPQLLAERARTQSEVLRGIGLNVRSINGEPHVALTRGLTTEMMEHEHPLSSHADLMDTGFGSKMHYAWTPVKDLWFAYDLDRTERSHTHMGPEDEYLVSNTGTRYEAQLHDVKKSRVKRWPKTSDYVYDDQTDEQLAGLVDKYSKSFGIIPYEVQQSIKTHQNAGPLVYEAQKRLWGSTGAYSIPAGVPPLGAFGHKWVPREDVMAFASHRSFGDSPAWYRNPNLTSQDLEQMSHGLLQTDPAVEMRRDAASVLLTHPAMNSHSLERIWRSAHMTPWMATLLASPLATHQMREDAIQTAKFVAPVDATAARNLMRGVTQSPHHTEEQARAVYDTHVGLGIFSRDAPSKALNFWAMEKAKLPLDIVKKLYDRRDELNEDDARGNRALGFMPGTRAVLTPDGDAERQTVLDLLHKYETTNPHAAENLAAIFGANPKRANVTRLLSRKNELDKLEPQLQSALINAVESDNHALLNGEQHQYLEPLASSPGLSQDTINYLANHKHSSVRDNLFRNKSVTPDQIRAAYPKSFKFPETRPSYPHTESKLVDSISEAYWRRREFEEKKARLHFIKPLPPDLAKSSEEDLWRAAARHWLADQTTKGFYAIVHKEVAEGALRDKAIEPQFTDELLEGEAVFGAPGTPESLSRLQRKAGPDDVVLFFETEVEPQQHTDGSLYWTSRVPCETIQMADVGDEPLAKMHTPLTFPKLGVEDDRRETKLVSTPRERKTFDRVAGSLFVRESYVTNSKSQGDVYEKFRANPALKRVTVDRDTKNVAKGNSPGIECTGNAGVGHPGHGVPRVDRDLIPNAGTGASSISAAFAPSANPRRKLSPAEAAVWQDPSYLPMVAHHEDLHRIFARIQHKHGERGREMLARNLVHVLPQDLQSAVMKHLYYAQPQKINDAYPEEEAITELTSYLNNAKVRDSFHKKQQHSSDQQKAFHDKMKRAYRLLLTVSPTVDEGWLHHEKPWMKQGQAMRKFTEPQSGTGLSAAEAHEVLKGSLKLSKSNPDLVTDPNAFAFKFETDPDLMDGIDSRHWELQLRKMSSLDETPTAAQNFMKEFQKRTAHNGFDERLGRYHSPTGDTSAGTLIVMSPRVKAWSDKPTVALDWIKALKPGNGDGHRSMKFITELADKHGVSVELHVGNEGSGGFKTSPKSMLHRFYKKHGFVKRGKFEKDILVRHATSHPVVEQGETLKLGSTMRTIKKAEDDEFDLAKMSVIHDDPKSPMTVYRVVDANTGRGPYSRPGEKSSPPRGQSPEDRARFPRSKKHPTPEPEVDFDARDYRDFEDGYKKIRFGFESRQGAYDWFGRDLSGAHGEAEYPPNHQVVKVLASKVWRSRSGKQVMFVPHRVRKSEDNFVLPTESVLKPGEESAAKAMLGHNKVHEAAMAAARFLVGRKEQVDDGMFTLAMNVFDGDVERAALLAVGMTDSEANLKALRAVLKLGEFSHEESSLSKNEPGTPHIETVSAGAPDAAETADEVKRGVSAGLVQPLVLKGKHSKGSMAVRDPKTGNVWLLKPGSGQQSPAAGARDDASSQSSREAAFWHCADRVGLGNYYPKADLLEVNAGQVAAMKLLGTQWKSLDERNRQVDGYAREVLQTYLDRGDIHRLAALDWILGNPDSHGQNVMVHAEAVALIDHGSAFAGPNFSPGRDSKSFTPYYLRVFAPSGYSKKKPEDRVQGLPRLSSHADSAFQKWVHSIDPALLAETMGSHGIGKVAQEAVLARLSDLQHHGGPSLSEYLNGLWAGL